MEQTDSHDHGRTQEHGRRAAYRAVAMHCSENKPENLGQIGCSHLSFALEPPTAQRDT